MLIKLFKNKSELLKENKILKYKVEYLEEEIDKLNEQRVIGIKSHGLTMDSINENIANFIYNTSPENLFFNKGAKQ